MHLEDVATRTTLWEQTVGGGAANSAWTRMRLKALGVPERPSLSEHAAVGTARLAWRGLGHAN